MNQTAKPELPEIDARIEVKSAFLRMSSALSRSKDPYVRIAATQQEIALQKDIDDLRGLRDRAEVSTPQQEAATAGAR